jgi:uncharacterized protein (TIGR02757 family)
MDALVARTDVAERIASDPVRFPRRYADARDVEVAAVLAAQLAFGRVDLFGPVVERVLAACGDEGPGAFATRFDSRRAGRLAGLGYRWFREGDFVHLFSTLSAAYRTVDRLGCLWARAPAAASLGGAIDRLRGFAPAGTSQAFATWFAHPRDGSACKRWCLLMRWMVRRDEVDLGVWSHLSTEDLVIPLDTHVRRVARFLGLTTRVAADWRAAEEVTAGLRRLDPRDPVRYDFALSHLGISGDCLGRREPAVCPRCPLDAVCRA